MGWIPQQRTTRHFSRFVCHQVLRQLANWSMARSGVKLSYDSREPFALTAIIVASLIVWGEFSAGHYLEERPVTPNNSDGDEFDIFWTMGGIFRSQA